MKRALTAASAWLARNIETLNALNVFPVPDGDTGTNMALTMQAAIKQIAQSPSHLACEIAQAVSHGALMGARGNSGVILSQILRGFSDGIAGKERINAREFAAGLQAATTTAYRAVLKPVEGTILTVIRETGEATVAAAAKANAYSYLLPECAKAAKASVARTPTLLAKLRDAGVVDAGGQGLYILLDGLRRYAEGEDLELSVVDGVTGPTVEMEMGKAHVEHGEYGYCTNFLLVGEGWEFDEVRARIATLGDSAVIVGDERIVKVHIHTENPGIVLSYACTLGSLRQINIANMQDQHDEFMEIHADGGEVHTAANNVQAADRDPSAAVAAGRIAVLAVAAGAGMAETFASMGATATIEGGQSMNPSTEDLFRAVERVPQNEVILLPNNGNIVMAARQVQSLTKKRVMVVPTDTMPQGMSALVAFNYEADLEANAKIMAAAAQGVQTAEVTRAVRDANVNGIAVKEGQVIGLLNNILVATGEERDAVAWEMLERMEASSRELITVYWGGDIPEAEASAFHDAVQERYSGAEVELIHGGQPFYDYIISAE